MKGKYGRRTEDFAIPHFEDQIAAMTLRISLVLLASLLFVTVLASLSVPANAYGVTLEEDGPASSARMMSAGPLNVIVFEMSER